MSTSQSPQPDTQELIVLTERAARQIKKIRQQEQHGENVLLRVGVKGGGCSGLSYTIDFDEEQDMDTIIEQHGVRILVDKRHGLYLDGTVVDFKDGLDARGFTFENPQASTTCGCGSSFSA
jgi:iron-sulfur cluster assembly protein